MERAHLVLDNSLSGNANFDRSSARHLIVHELMKRRTTLNATNLFGSLLLGLVVLPAANAQVLLNEQFTGGASTTGFTIVSTPDSDCEWTFAPGDLTESTFSVDTFGEVVSGGGFDDDFAFLDSDACGGSGITVNSTLVSPAFDASGATALGLTFAHQFFARLASFGKVEVFNGAVWTEVALYTVTDVGYPNPAANASLNITAAAGGSANARIRFQFSSGWDWWWALDNIVVTASNCIFPSGLAVNGITQSGATVSWTDNGSPGYDWVVTDGALPDGANAIASGTGANTTITGLAPGTPYTVFVRAQCDGGGTSEWAQGVAFVTGIANDECINAVPLTVNANYACAATSPGTVSGATASNVTTTCFGTPDDDVWFSFTATETFHRVSLINITGSTGDMYHALWSGSCGSLTLVPNSCSDPQTSDPTDLTVGEIYYLQVYTWTATPAQTSVFDVCIGTLGPTGISENKAGSALRVFPVPASTQLTVDLADPQGGTMRVVDATGRLVQLLPLARNLDVSGLRSGAYFVLAFDRAGSLIGRAPFVKQ